MAEGYTLSNAMDVNLEDRSAYNTGVDTESAINKMNADSTVGRILRFPNDIADTRHQMQITIFNRSYDTSVSSNVTSKVDSTSPVKTEELKGTDLTAGIIENEFSTNLSGSISEGADVISSALSAKKPELIADIVLPFPVDVSTTYNAEWNAIDLSSGDYILSEIIKGIGGSNEKSVSSIVGRGVGTAASRIGLGLAQNVISNFGADLRRAGSTSGIGFNPYRELMYTSPSFRTFNFDWILSPRNAKEQETLQEIIFTLKKYMHPQVTNDDQALFLYPAFCKVGFYSEGVENPFIFKLYETAIASCTFRYDNKMHQLTNGPTAISLSLSLFETQILTQKDFGVFDRNKQTY